MKPAIKSDGDGSSAGRSWKLPRPDWALLILGLLLMTIGIELTFGVGVSLMVLGAAIIAVAIIL